MCNFWDMYPSGFNSWACFSGTGPTDLQTISKMPWSVVSRTGWRRSVQDQWWWPQIGGGLDWSSMMLRNFRNVITDLSWIMDPIKRSILSLAASFRYFYLFFETWFDLEDLLSYDWHPTHTHTMYTMYLIHQVGKMLVITNLVITNLNTLHEEFIPWKNEWKESTDFKVQFHLGSISSMPHCTFGDSPMTVTSLSKLMHCEIIHPQ